MRKAPVALFLSLFSIGVTSGCELVGSDGDFEFTAEGACPTGFRLDVTQLRTGPTLTVRSGGGTDFNAELLHFREVGAQGVLDFSLALPLAPETRTVLDAAWRRYSQLESTLSHRGAEGQQIIQTVDTALKWFDGNGAPRAPLPLVIDFANGFGTVVTPKDWAPWGSASTFDLGTDGGALDGTGRLTVTKLDGNTFSGSLTDVSFIDRGNDCKLSMKRYDIPNVKVSR